ncbi:MAG TPA: penicillin-binding protein activator [Kofleriaceae bacterium]
MTFRTVALALLVIVLAACPRPTRKTMVPDVPQSGNADARARFSEARAKFMKDGRGGAEFARIVEEYPDDPIVPWAQLYAGIAAVKARKYQEAATALQEVIDSDAPPGLARRAELFLGITKNYQGEAARALKLLKNGADAIENDDERTEYIAAVAYATSVTEPLASLKYFDQLYPRVSPAERALIVARTEEVVIAAPTDGLRRVFDSLPERKGPSMAAVASRLAVLADQAGNASEAQRMREAAAPARAAVGLPRNLGEIAAPSGSGSSGLVGAIVPLGGKSNKVAEQAVAGLGMAAGVGDGKGVAAIEVRTAQDPAGAALAVEELARANVIAVVGPIDGASVDAAGGRAEGLGIPLLSLSPNPERRTTGKFVFHVVHSAEARARMLAQQAIAKGVKTFAVLAPESGYGKAVAAAFVSAVQSGGGSIVTTVTYPEDTKSFVAFTGKLSGSWQGVFVPENAVKLGLIAPALSTSGRVPKPVGTKRVAGGGRPVVLLSTAENLTGALLAAADRHVEGALLAPGFYPDDQDATQKPFLDRFISSFGRAPGAIEAYAYDAAQLAAAAGGGGRTGLAGTLARGSLTGITGTIRFDSDHRRADPGVLYTVVESSGTFAIRVAK